MSARRIALLVLSICVLAYALYNIITTLVQLPELREETLNMFSDPQISAVIPDPTKIVDLVVGIAIFSGCLGAVFYCATGILGIVASVGKYRGGAHIVLSWIYVIFSALGLIITVVGFIMLKQFDWSVLLNVFIVAVGIAVIVIGKKVKEGED